MKNPIRTLSGVAPIAVMIPPRKCPHGTCSYCPSLDAPQSYTPKSPAVIRAISVSYNPKEQVKLRIKQLKNMGHPTDKIELIIMGGTFLGFPEEFQYDFIKKCYEGLNGIDSNSFEEAKRLNEKAENRCVALCIETRPDVCSEKEIKNMLKFGCTRVELGVQALDDEIYKKINRGHNVLDVINATKRAKEHGFKVGYHIMPGLPGSNPKKDYKMFETLFKNEDFRPDQLKIYPCQVLKGAALANLYEKGEYKPYSLEEAKDLLLQLLPIVPRYCRVMRIMREIPKEYLIAGISDISLRQKLEEEMLEKKIKTKEIRAREIGHSLLRNAIINSNIKIKKLEYGASGGREIFLEAVNEDDILFGLLRLRFNEKYEAIVREVHVYGQALKLGERGQGKFQHRGIGKSLLQKAEEIAKSKGFEKIKIISGVGAREYYRKFGYLLEGDYMEKLL